MNDRFNNFLIFVVVGILAGVATFRLASQGKLALPNDTIQNQSRVVVQEEDAVINAVEKSSPSVVAIGVTQRVINPFSPFSQPRQQQSTIGTGFVVSKGVIVTNKHVVSDSSLKYTVVTRDGKKIDVTKIYRDPVLDLAIIQISDTTLKPLEMGDSSKLKIGQTVIAIGNALGRFDNTVTTGVVSGLGRSVNAGDPFGQDVETLDNLIQTDAAINPGNSGGPLLNLSDEVIGVNVATTEGAQNIGFAIPINQVKAIVEEFSRTGTVSKAYLGIRYSFVDKDQAVMYQLPAGAYIQDVLEDSPADKAGLAPGDVITKVDGANVDTENKISGSIQGKKVGDKMTLEVWTDGKTRSVTATLGESPNQ
jgi:serine protease Do